LSGVFPFLLRTLSCLLLSHKGTVLALRAPDSAPDFLVHLPIPGSTPKAPAAATPPTSSASARSPTSSPAPPAPRIPIRLGQEGHETQRRPPQNHRRSQNLRRFGRRRTHRLQTRLHPPPHPTLLHVLTATRPLGDVAGLTRSRCQTRSTCALIFKLHSSVPNPT